MFISQNKKKTVRAISIIVIYFILQNQLAWAYPPEFSSALRPLATANLDVSIEPAIPLPALPITGSEDEGIAGRELVYNDSLAKKVHTTINLFAKKIKKLLGLSLMMLLLILSYNPLAMGEEWQFSQLKNSIYEDHKTFYSGKNLEKLAVGLVPYALLANTSADKKFQDWYQDSVKSERIDKFSDAVKSWGEGKMSIPVCLTAAILGRLTDDTKIGLKIGEWGARSSRAFLVGAPPMLFLQYITGASRPDEGDSHEGDSQSDPFKDNNGVSGHSFMGAVPFITAAKMTDNPYLKYPLYLASTLCGLSRINDNDHYLSQSALGWWVAYLATTSVNKVEIGKWKVVITPILIPNGAGVMVTIPLSSGTVRAGREDASNEAKSRVLSEKKEAGKIREESDVQPPTKKPGVLKALIKSLGREDGCVWLRHNSKLSLAKILEQLGIEDDIYGDKIYGEDMVEWCKKKFVHHKIPPGMTDEEYIKARAEYHKIITEELERERNFLKTIASHKIENLFQLPMFPLDEDGLIDIELFKKAKEGSRAVLKVYLNPHIKKVSLEWLCEELNLPRPGRQLSLFEESKTRVLTIKSMQADNDLNQKAVKKLTSIPDILTIVGAKPPEVINGISLSLPESGKISKIVKGRKLCKILSGQA